MLGNEYPSQGGPDIDEGLNPVFHHLRVHVRNGSDGLLFGFCLEEVVGNLNSLVPLENEAEGDDELDNHSDAERDDHDE